MRIGIPVSAGIDIAFRNRSSLGADSSSCNKQAVLENQIPALRHVGNLRLSQGTSCSSVPV